MSNGCAIDLSSDFTLELTVTKALCEVIDSPRSLAVKIMIDHGLWQDLLDLECNPLHYQDHSNFADDYLATSLLQKSVNLPTGIDKHSVALKSFWDSEASCKMVNDRLFSLPIGGLPPLIERARSLIHRVLGPLTKEDLQFVEDSFRFGPGATTAVSGVGSVTSDKFDEEIHLTEALYPFYKSVLGQTWWDQRSSPVIVEGNRFTSVPKNAKTNRGICVEPTLNIFVQLGIGALLRRRLRRLGIDLSDQTKNQKFAARAYSERLATIDLSAASDSLAYSTVISLLPEDWVELLDLARSPKTQVEGEYVTLEKFSSMGNGYTFELETLIFAALAFVCCPGETDRIAVYGDDIILPANRSKSLIDALDFLGFRVNERKSFLAGNFFESCGVDFFKGQPVRPFFLRKSSESKQLYTIQIMNSLRLYASMRCNYRYCDSRFRSLWVQLKKLIPKPWSMCSVPPQMGNSGIIVSLREARYIQRPKNWGEGWIVQHVVQQPKKVRKRTIGRLLAALACGSPIPTRGFEPRRGLFGRFVLRRTTILSWCEGLEWTPD